MNKHQKKTGPRFIQLFYWMFDTPAWKDLDAVSRAIYVELTARYNGSNNGRIAYSARQAAEELKISKDTAARGAERPPAHGFIVCEKRGAFPLQGATRQRISADHLRQQFNRRLRQEALHQRVRTVARNSEHGPCGRTDGACGRTVRSP